MKEVSEVEVTLDFSNAINVKSFPTGVSIIHPYTLSIITHLRAYDTDWTTECSVRIVKRAPTLEK